MADAKKDWTQLVFGALSLQRSNRPGVSLGLTIRFGIEKIWIRRLSMWRRPLRIGVREANLKFILTNALMPDDDWAFDQRLDMSLEVKRTESATLTVGNEHEASGNLKASLTGALDAKHGASPVKASAGWDAAIQDKSKQSGERKDEVMDEFQFQRQLVTSSGGPSNPVWNVRSLMATEVLRGPAIKTQYFARVIEDGNEPQLKLVAEIPRSGILVEDETGSFKTPNKRTLARYMIQRALCDQPITLDEVDELPETEVS